MNKMVNDTIQTTRHIAAEYERTDKLAERALAQRLDTDRWNIAKVLTKVNGLQLDGKHEEAALLLHETILFLQGQFG